MYHFRSFLVTYRCKCDLLSLFLTNMHFLRLQVVLNGEVSVCHPFSPASFPEVITSLNFVFPSFYFYSFVIRVFQNIQVHLPFMCCVVILGKVVLYISLLHIGKKIMKFQSMQNNFPDIAKNLNYLTIQVFLHKIKHLNKLLNYFNTYKRMNRCVSIQFARQLHSTIYKLHFYLLYCSENVM